MSAPADLCPQCWERAIVKPLSSPYPCKHQGGDGHTLEPSRFAFPVERVREGAHVYFKAGSDEG